MMSASLLFVAWWRGVAGVAPTWPQAKRHRCRRAAGQGGRDLRESDVLAHNRVAAPRSAAS
eukprot:6482209-Prymnesium_polylepis.1